MAQHSTGLAACLACPDRHRRAHSVSTLGRSVQYSCKERQRKQWKPREIDNPGDNGDSAINLWPGLCSRHAGIWVFRLK